MNLGVGNLWEGLDGEIKFYVYCWWNEI